MPSRRKLVLIATGVVVVSLGLWAFSRVGAQEPKGGEKKTQAVPVKTATVAVKPVPILVRAIGQTEPSSTVDVRAQASGQVTRIAFKEGDVVRKGQVLFGLDPRVSQTDVAEAQANYERAIAAQRQAEATLAKDQALARNAQAEEKRYAQLVETGVVSRSQYDSVRTNAEAAVATAQADKDAANSQKKAVAAAKAVLDASQVQLSFTTVTAPVDGKTGALQVHQGDVVEPNGQTPLVVINQLSPIFVTFSIPEAEFVRLKQAMPNGTIPVQAAPAADPGAVSDGSLSFVDNTVDPSTGTIKLKATFANADQRLWPGQFVNVTVTLGVENDAVTIPKDSVQTGQQGQYVFVVTADDKAEMRPVEVARVVGDDAIVSSGLQNGERVVTEGQLKLTPGVAVKEASGGEAQQPQQGAPS